MGWSVSEAHQRADAREAARQRRAYALVHGLAPGERATVGRVRVTASSRGNGTYTVEITDTASLWLGRSAFRAREQLAEELRRLEEGV